MTTILRRIVEQKQQELALAKRRLPLAELQYKEALPLRDFIAPLQQANPAIIAEIKKASPSQGIIRQDFNVASIAQIYEQNGARCLSVLTEREFFQGDPSYISIAKTHSTLPVLRKDFIIDSYQLYESRAIGADCILLIVALLSDNQLHEYCQLAQELGMAVLVESHSLAELNRAIRLPTPLMGINNRNLKNFHTDIQLSLDLSSHLPADKIMISESGIHSHHEIQQLQAQGIHTFLIGESLMRAEDIGEKLRKFVLIH